MSICSDKFSGCLLGLAVGDALGLPGEGLSPRRAAHMFGSAPLHHQFLLHRGMVSDDTDHACMTAQALLASTGDPNAFARSLAWRLRGWLLSIPAGIGLATLRSILKLWCGFPPDKSGVYSAGNGPAMRAPILGLWIAATNADLATANALVNASTRLTHTDPRAAQGALAIALATAHAALHGPAHFTAKELLPKIEPHVTDPELRSHLAQIPLHLDRRATPAEFAQSLNLQNGVTGYINHTVPIVLYCCLRWPNDFRQAVESVILLGGDTDTTAAIVGAISGACLGPQAIPNDWFHGLADYPRSTTWIRTLAVRLAHEAQLAPKHRTRRTLPLSWFALALRSPLFIVVVLLHGFRRLLPPY